MFANTLTLTIDAVPKVLNRINQDNRGSEYSFVSGTETISMLIRHTVDKLATGDVNRHNVYIERTIFATPTVVEKYFSVTFTLRERRGSDPLDELKLAQGFYTLIATLDDGLVVGEN
jgi:hypothetical protein